MGKVRACGDAGHSSGSKSGRLLCPFPCMWLGPHLTQCRLGRGLPPYQVVLSRERLMFCARNLHTSLVLCQVLKPTFEIFYPTPKNWRGKPQISLTRRQTAVSRKRVTLKGLIISTNKNISFIYDKCAKNGTKLGASPHGVLMQHMEKIDKL